MTPNFLFQLQGDFKGAFKGSWTQKLGNHASLRNTPKLSRQFPKLYRRANDVSKFGAKFAFVCFASFCVFPSQIPRQIHESKCPELWMYFRWVCFKCFFLTLKYEINHFVFENGTAIRKWWLIRRGARRRQWWRAKWRLFRWKCF